MAEIVWDCDMDISPEMLVVIVQEWMNRNFICGAPKVNSVHYAPKTDRFVITLVDGRRKKESDNGRTETKKGK